MADEDYDDPEDRYSDRYDDEENDDYRHSSRYDDEEDDDYHYSSRYEDEEDEDYPYAGRSYSRGRSSRDGRRDDRKGGILLFFSRMGMMEKAAMFIGAVIIAGIVGVSTLYASAKTQNDAVASFASLGEDIYGVEIIGESGLLAVAEANKVSIAATESSSEEEEEEETGITVKMNLSSIQSDLKIKFNNASTGKLIASVPFTVTVKTPDGSTVTYEDDDQDGIIYKKGISAGKYTVSMNLLTDSKYENYIISTESQKITVKDTIEYKTVDVSDEIKKESEVNVAKEDTQVKTEVESTLTDTVEYVESTKTESGTDANSTEYKTIDKSTIVDPASSAMLNVDKSLLSLDGLLLTSATDAATASTASEASGSGGTVEKEYSYLVSLSSSSIKVGETSTASASTDYSDKTVTWSSSSDSVATVSSDGTVTGKAAGTATITAKFASGKTASATITVTEVEETHTIKATIASSSIKVGATTTVSATDNGSSTSATWSSSNDSVATVSTDGTVTGKAAGTATITATCSNGTATVSVTVTEDAHTYEVKADATSIKAGATTKVTAYDNSTATSVTWSVDKTSIATISATSGSSVTVTGVAEGSAVITATYSSGKTATVTITVAKNTYAVSKETTTLAVKGTETIKATKNGTEESVTWSTSDSSIVTISATSGSSVTLTGVKAGTANITATFSDKGTAVCKVTVTSSGTITLSPTSLIIVAGKTSSSITATTANLSSTKVTWAIADTSIATIASSSDTTVTVKGVKAGTTTLTATSASDTTITAKLTITVKDSGAYLVDKSGNAVYVKDATSGTYRKATYDDYYNYTTFYIATAGKTYTYTGWQVIDGYTYYYDKNGNYVTGEQVIQGAKYTFGSDGRLSTGSGVMGIDVSKWNGNIDWAAVKNSGVNFVIIRCGYRGSSAGALIEDSMFKKNISGALNAGLKVGVYFFTQAINEAEAVEEASMVASLCKGYSLSYPVFLDVEASNGRGDKISADQRTAVIKAFCSTMASAGYKTGVYANKTWLNSNINATALTSYRIWLAQYAATPTYTRTRYDMWQYSSKGKVSGISGNVDMNISYLGY